MLIHFGVIPYLVFDGDYLPSKAGTEVERAKRREETKKKGLELYRLNKLSQAHLELQRAVEVTPTMARELIEELKISGVKYLVAPYEADAQLVYLEKKGIIQATISEDSDLLVFGAKNLLTKLDQYGDCIEIDRSDFAGCRGISLVGWTDAEFRRMAILSGCDYLSSIPGMGLKNAYRLVRKYKNFDKILRVLQFDGKFHVPSGYPEAFQRADLTFLHQRVFCPLKNDVTLLTELEAGSQPDDFSFVGARVEQHLAAAVAKGDLDPTTKAPIFCSTFGRNSKIDQVNPRSGKGEGTPLLSLKGNHSIDTFFKAQRTPLAELNPNCFTPSPTQERLLQRAASHSWESTPVPAATVTDLFRAQERPVPIEVNTSSVSSQENMTRPTQHFTNKRRRLYEEINESRLEEQLKKESDERSPFFAKNSSRNTQTKFRNKIEKAKNSEIKIWSDNSVDEMMAKLREPSTLPVSTKDRKIEAEPLENSPDNHSSVTCPLSIRQEQPVSEDSQISVFSRDAPSFCSSAEISFTSTASTLTSTVQILDESVRAELASLAAIQRHQAMGENGSSQTSKQRPDTDTIDGALIKPSIRSCLSRPGSATPLQRLKEGALKRSKYCSGTHKIRSSEKRSHEKVTELHVRKSPSRTTPGLPLNHSSSPDASVWKGSEDLLIPDSEEDMSDQAQGMYERR